MKTKRISTFFALLAATLYAVNIPLSKLLLTRVSPTIMAAFLYLGAGLGLLIWSRFTKESAPPLTARQLPYILGMILLDIAAPILLMLGLTRTNAASAALLNNFEIVATSLLAFSLFREALSRTLVVAIGLVTAASVLLTFEGSGGLQLNGGSLLVLAAACCWGLENNCTRMLSNCSSVQITSIKGIFSGLGSLTVALILGEEFPGLGWLGAVMLLGFVAYGLSINFYIKAQKELGAAKTSAYYSIAPFLGVIFGMLLLGEQPELQFWIGLSVMLAATALLVKDTVSLQHTHEHRHTHTHPHAHAGRIHTHEHSHVHNHTHTHSADETDHSHDHRRPPEHDHHHDFEEDA